MGAAVGPLHLDVVLLAGSVCGQNVKIDGAALQILQGKLTKAFLHLQVRALQHDAQDELDQLRVALKAFAEKFIV